LNILFIANRFPYPPYRGDKLKIYNLAKHLSKSHNLFLLTFIQDKADYQYLDILKKYFNKIQFIYLPKYKSTLHCAFKILSSKPFQIIYFESKKFKLMVNDFVENNKIDIIHTQHLRMAQYTNELNKYKRILDLPDAYSLYWERRTGLKRNIFKRFFDHIEYKKVLKYEEIIKEFDLNLVCSEEDRSFLSKYHNFDRVSILPNGVDLDKFQGLEHDYKIDNEIIFTGNMDYTPNIDAVCYFVNEIFPIILKTCPNVKFRIVGQKPVKKVRNLSSKNALVKGFVDDLAGEYNSCAIAVSPVRIGAGTLNKVLEPMALGLPVVSSVVGFKGLGIKSGEGVILANGKQDFAVQVIKLLKDANVRRSVGSKGKKIIEEKFSWDCISHILENIFFDLSKEKGT
jgi:sugar transferase (PEP-CTERM/EpsH1 system associated)